MLARIIVIALVAGFIAIMAAGPGIMIPGHFDLWAPVVCGQVGEDFEPVVEKVNRGTYRDATGVRGGTQFTFLCTDGDETEDVTGRLVGTAFGGYFIVLFILFSIIAAFKGKPKQAAPGGPQA